MGGIEEFGDASGRFREIQLDGDREGEGHHGVLVLDDQLLGLRQEIPQPLRYDAEEDLLLALEAVVEAPVEDAGPLDYVAGGGLLVALIVEQVHGRFHDLPAGLLAPLFHRLRCTVVEGHDRFCSVYIVYNTSPIFRFDYAQIHLSRIIYY